MKINHSPIFAVEPKTDPTAPKRERERERSQIAQAAALMASFPLKSLNASSAEALKGLAERIPERMPECAPLCWGLHARLAFAHATLAPQVELYQMDDLKCEYARIVVNFVKLLKAKPLLVRLAKSDALVNVIEGLHARLDAVFIGLGLGEADEMTRWKREWADGIAEQQAQLLELVPRSTGRRLVNEINGDKMLKEALMALYGSLNQQGQAQAILELRQKTYDRVAKCTHDLGLRLFKWFISIEDVEFEDEAIGIGTFSGASRGTWLHDGKRQDVVIKTLFRETNESDEEPFLKQLQFWYALPPHPNILQLYGGSHVSSPPFFVCENAHGGDMMTFLGTKRDELLFWPLFLQFAEGLKFLHKRNVVHGGLKCNNVLVGKGNTAKIADFGFSRVRSLSLGLSKDGSKAQDQAVRWMATEALNPIGLDEPLPESDLYSLGMCMVAAITQEIPFGYDLTDDEVTKMISNGESHPRPDEATDEAWELISRLCAPVYQDRPSLDNVIADIRALVEQGAKQAVARSRGE
ncbi:hypothetical protein BBJ28_00016328 [Nothophytophthora sp. Chile5]|nr:hypothetical protein BBJ28_00016328 [Nothophytophthora sp. Chile5]